MILLLDKPKGFTSFDLIRKLKKLYKGEKIGHAGTLDPAATGLMIIAIGKDTKKLHGLTGLDKSYVTTIDFSLLTDTWDLDVRAHQEQYTVEGMTLIKSDGTKIQAPTQEQLQDMINTKVGTHMMPLTPFSAKKVDGKKLYEYAREGNPIFMDVPMTIHHATIVSYDFPSVTIELSVGSGTYIRSIGYWLGKQFNLGGTLTELRRTQVGKWVIPQ